MRRTEPPGAARRSPVDPMAVSPMPMALAEQVADAMFALATPSRVQILWRLRSAPMSVGELASELGMEQSAVSHQLRVLREHSLIRVERLGRHRVYALSDDEVAVFLEAVRRHLDSRSDPAPGSGRRTGSGA